MDFILADPIQNPQNQSLAATPGSVRTQKQINGLEYVAVRMYAAGKRRLKVAEVLGPRFFPELEPLEARKRMVKRLRRWEETQWFRDWVWNYSMVESEMEIPTILRGVRSRAKRGRVDAARLVLEVTGRHNPRGEQSAPAVVQITFGGSVPRPGHRFADQPNGREALPPTDDPDAEVVDAELVDES
jgi:hypothetical protein